MRKLYLHVGVHRTGTTSIQRFSRANAAALLERGYLYPFGVARHNGVVGKLRYGIVQFDDFARDLDRRAAARDAHSVILSDEDISTIADISRFGALTQHFEVKVVVALRRQDLWLESWYLQNLKWQWDPTLSHVSLDEFYARRHEFFWIDYAARLAEYEATFGAGSVIAGVFEPAEMPQGPVAAFLDQVGIKDLEGFGPMLRQNSSMSARVSEFMRHLPLDEIAEKDRRVFEQAAAMMDRDMRHNGSRLLLPYARRIDVLEEHRAGNDAVAARYFKRRDLFQEPLPAPDAPLADATLPQSTEDLMQEFVVPYIRALGAQMQALRVAAEESPHPKKDRVRART